MMQNIFRNMYNRTKEDKTIVEIAVIEPEEEQRIYKRNAGAIKGMCRNSNAGG